MSEVDGVMVPKVMGNSRWVESRIRCENLVRCCPQGYGVAFVHE